MEPGTDPYASQFEVLPLPQPGRKPPTVPEFHRCLKQAKNKGQKLRCCFRLIGSWGYLTDMEPELWGQIEEYLLDFDPKKKK